jgi:hypothetical protein
MRKIILSLLVTMTGASVNAQDVFNKNKINTQANGDSVAIAVHPSYLKVSGVHRWFFGTNYRKEWAAKVKLPFIRISEIQGGLVPVKEGGGMQSKSLRLADKSGKEWVIRSVEKTPDKLLPDNLKGTFAVDWVDDAMSAQHPFSALIMPPLAEAAGVYHTNPIIGVVAPDNALGDYKNQFSGMVVLLEEREPAGESDNTPKMIKELNEDHDNRFDGEQFLRARLLDVLTGDWDRHEDQWRWVIEKNGKDKVYRAVPRDRDQVFHVNQGLFPSVAALPWINPMFGNFDGEIASIKYLLYKTKFLNGYPDAQLSYPEYMQIVNTFVAAETDEVLEAGLKRLPPEIYGIRHADLFAKLKKRRDNIPAAMVAYYKFISRIRDIRTSDKSEQVTITDEPGNDLRVVIVKLDKSGQFKDTLMNRVYNHDLTKEIRLYVGDGDDQVSVRRANSPIRLRVIGGKGNKNFDVRQAAGNLKVYNGKDSLDTRFVPVNPYNVLMPLATAAINADDGFLLGLGFRYKQMDGFRKLPYTSIQQLMVSHSFATAAFRIRYSGEWLQAVGKADLLLQAYLQAPDNTMNFFGRGNETVLNKFENYRTYHRTRYDTYQFDPALRWRTGEGTAISAGPSIQFYHLNRDDNQGRLINQPAFINSYDSLTVDRDKAHAGLQINLVSNKRNNDVLPSSGYYLNVNIQGYTGLNHYSRSFLQIRPEFTYYQRLNAKGTIVISDRIGGGLTAGDAAFYQSMFLGGQGNLLGYLQNRFAGEHMVYNNFQARLKLFNIASYILPGQLGLTGFYDAGRVWEKGEHSDKWHQGTGAGVYFAPAGLTIVQLLAGHSTEGWYPYISMNFRL